jgi:hypothetical protein
MINEWSLAKYNEKGIIKGIAKYKLFVEVIIIKNENDYNFEKMIIKVKFKD